MNNGLRIPRADAIFFFRREAADVGVEAGDIAQFSIDFGLRYRSAAAFALGSVDEYRFSRWEAIRRIDEIVFALQPTH